MRNLINKSNVIESLNLSKTAVRILGLTIFVILGSISASANHPVFVEGNCLAPNTPTVLAGTCGDYDGDGKIGVDEDNDGDRVFGTIKGALGVNGVNDNGTVTIVTSGVFSELNITITGNVTLQGAPGVSAIIDAVLQGDANSAQRQLGNGITINTIDNRTVALRNITIKNYRIGINSAGASKISMENVRVENCVDYGIILSQTNALSMVNSSVTSTGFRISSVGTFPTANMPNPGYGIYMDSSSKANIISSNISHNFARGITNVGGGNLCISQSSFINNGSANVVNTGAGALTFPSNGCYQ